ncbi:MAG: DUF4303 domain-containing protein [Pirellulales bacterium]
MSLREPNAIMQEWLDQDDAELLKSIKSEIRTHVAKLQARGDQFYGYAVLPGVPYEVTSLIVIFNRESDLDPEKGNETFYRYAVDEWANYEHEVFANSNKLIASRNSVFNELLEKIDPYDFSADDFEVAHVDKLHGTILKAMDELRLDGLFDNDAFLVMWISDSGHEIMGKSVKRLNSESVYKLLRKSLASNSITGISTTLVEQMPERVPFALRRNNLKHDIRVR